MVLEIPLNAHTNSWVAETLLPVSENLAIALSISEAVLLTVISASAHTFK